MLDTQPRTNLYYVRGYPLPSNLVCILIMSLLVFIASFYIWSRPYTDAKTILRLDEKSLQRLPRSHDFVGPMDKPAR